MAVSQYKADDCKIHEQERDIFKMWCGWNRNSILLGIENQTVYDKDMPFRIMGYDGASYRSQIMRYKVDNFDKNRKISYKERYPVITMVLYYGETGWRESSNLVESFFPQIPDNRIGNKISRYISDYHINVFDIGNLDKEEVQKFQSDFRMVAEYFVNVRNPECDYVPSDKSIIHVDEFLKLMSVLTGDNRYEEYVNLYTEEEKRGGMVNMCRILDARETKGRTEGRVEGEQRLLKLIARLVEDNKNEEITSISSDDVLRNRLYMEYGL